MLKLGLDVTLLLTVVSYHSSLCLEYMVCGKVAARRSMAVGPIVDFIVYIIIYSIDG